MRAVSTLLGLTCAGVAACGGDIVFPFGRQACTAAAHSSIRVAIVDSITGVGLAAGASLILQDGAYVDSVVFGAGVSVFPDGRSGPSNTFERAGTYDVRVRRPEYRLWERPGVRVLQGECHVQTVHLEARLQRAP